MADGPYNNPGPCRRCGRHDCPDPDSDVCDANLRTRKWKKRAKRCKHRLAAWEQAASMVEEQTRRDPYDLSSECVVEEIKDCRDRILREQEKVDG